MPQGWKCQRGTGRCICFWRGKCAGEAFAGRRGGSKKWKSEFKNIRNFRMRKHGKLSGIIRYIWHTGSIVRIWQPEGCAGISVHKRTLFFQDSQDIVYGLLPLFFMGNGCSTIALLFTIAAKPCVIAAGNNVFPIDLWHEFAAAFYFIHI